jgi:hypothetical protein
VERWRFAPVYKIYRGQIGYGAVINQQDFPAPGPDYTKEAEAFQAAAALAAAWLAANETV